jgi:NAD(P)H-hydrate epimerase
MSKKIVDKSIIKKIYKKRRKESHKDDFGRLLIIGGSNKYSGSPSLNALSALSAYRSGVDIAEVIAPRRASDIIASFSPDIITIPLKGDYIGQKKSHLKKVKEQSENKTGFVIGGGIERRKKTLDFVRKFLKNTKLKGVIDADAIYALHDKKNRQRKIDLSDFVITPHSYEFYILTGEKAERNLNKKIKQVKKQAKKLNTTILLKGKEDIISDGTRIMVNKTGNAFMTVGGTGDILAGMLGSLIAQGNPLFDSACAAAYINGKAGEISKKHESLISSDLIDKIALIVDKK